MIQKNISKNDLNPGPIDSDLRSKDLFQPDLSILGWDAHFQQHFETVHDKRVFPARVVEVHKNSFLVHQGHIEMLVTVAGRLSHPGNLLYPVAGDWVIIEDKVICDILPRKNTLARKAAGQHGKKDARPDKEQVIAANIDTVFIVSGLDRDFNVRRIERYLTLVYNCGLNPVIVLTKADLQNDPEQFADEVEAVAFGVPVHLVSAGNRQSMAPLETYISTGQTISLVGSSGAGKSTLVNALYGESVQPTGDVSETTGKGKHTTTNRSIIMMPQGGMVMDNPGIREIGLQEGDSGLDAAFPEIERLARGCRFGDCSHSHEPGCNVLSALADGEISQERLESYRKMEREMAYLSGRQQKSADRLEKERWKGVALKVKAMKKRGQKG